MRYGACTQEDIQFLRSCQISKRSGHPTFDDPRFRNVSLITAWNSQKDKVNELGCLKFAEETGQQLIDFFSEDTLAENSSSTERKSRTNRKKKVVRARRALTEQQKVSLWNAPPCTSEHIPGKLSLCIGLPVMIRNNDATELCMTKGQDRTVVGWQEATGASGQNLLDTLFLKLTKPPKTIKIPDLPENVVALTRNSNKIWSSLPDDTTVNIVREQVSVLPNFAMTDYSSQGKTRELNVCDLTNCRTHFSYYTALFRGTSADGTVILQGFETHLITSGITGFLRQEFRELEMLNEITRLRYEGNLPDEGAGSDRIELLRSYQTYKGKAYDLSIFMNQSDGRKVMNLGSGALLRKPDGNYLVKIFPRRPRGRRMPRRGNPLANQRVKTRQRPENSKSSRPWQPNGTK
ncbi:hypothetical protein FB451DRAFT_1033244 [Mycena latifolia]|nr:hypothetical protein FB451DRAFT_1033244 [Mycena latifolia]